MLKFLISLLAFYLHFVCSDASNVLWYNKESVHWTDALPIGNGHLGAMIFGGVVNEHIQFNEDTLWTGKPHDYSNPEAFKYLSEIRKLIFEGHAGQALNLANGHFLSNPKDEKWYMPFGDLRIHFPEHNNFTNYKRQLDLDNAIAGVTYKVNGVTHNRKVFASFPDNVIVMLLTADHNGNISFTLKMDTQHKSSKVHVIGHDTLSLSGQVEAGGVKFESRAHVVINGGNITSAIDSITVTKAHNVIIYLTAATSFKNFHDISADPSERLTTQSTKLSKRNYTPILTDHLKDYHNLFNRVTLDLGHTSRMNLSTDERLHLVSTKGPEDDPELVAIYFQFGRYLLISSSRFGTQPANLQGIWNDNMHPPWGSKWTSNINLEMNYWPSEVTNLQEMNEPLFDLTEGIAITGHRVAKVHYNASGWVFHHNADIWRAAAPDEGIWGLWPTAGAWLMHHMWEHYLFNGDKNFLAKRAYPLMKESAQFFVDTLVKHPKYGYMVTAPSFSPEQGDLCAGPTMDNQIIRALFEYTIEAAKILNMEQDKDFISKLNDLRNHLPPNKIGKSGQLQEWLEDIDKPNNGHRHMSPLWALFPGSDITPENNKTIFDAAKKLLTWRGMGWAGWSLGWRIALWARVGDGEYAYAQLKNLLQHNTLTDMFDNCSPFQIDGNFGAASGIAEMLLQSHIRDSHGTFTIDLLPALPKVWTLGTVKGLRARDGFEVDIAWDKHKLTKVTIHSKLGRTVNVRYGSHVINLKTEKDKSYNFDVNLKELK